MPRVRGLYAVRYTLDVVAKVLLLINARLRARARWMFATDPARTLGRDSVAGKRLLVTVSGIAKLGVDCAGDRAGFAEKRAVLEELIPRNRKYPHADSARAVTTPLTQLPICTSFGRSWVLRGAWARLLPFRFAWIQVLTPLPTRRPRDTCVGDFGGNRG